MKKMLSSVGLFSMQVFYLRRGGISVEKVLVNLPRIGKKVFYEINKPGWIREIFTQIANVSLTKYVFSYSKKILPTKIFSLKYVDDDVFEKCSVGATLLRYFSHLPQSKKIKF